MAQRVEHNLMAAAMAALVSHGLGGFNCGCPILKRHDKRGIVAALVFLLNLLLFCCCWNDVHAIWRRSS